MALGVPNQLGVEPGGSNAPVDTVTLDDMQRHFARELHDQIAQPLIGLLLEMRELRSRLGTLTDFGGELTRLEEAVRKVLRQCREMMVDLRDRGDLRLNLHQALKNDIPVPSGRELALQVTSRWPAQINGWAAFNLLRIVQQAVANAWQHGRAGKVDVILDVGATGDALVVILDDGGGIDGAPSGFGMTGIQERTAILGGTLTADQRSGGGTRVEVRFPAGRLA